MGKSEARCSYKFVFIRKKECTLWPWPMVNLRNSLISILCTNVFKDPPLVYNLLPKKPVYTIIHLTFTFNQVTVMLVTFDSHYYKSYQYVYVSSRSELLFMITSLNMFVLHKCIIDPYFWQCDLYLMHFFAFCLYQFYA